MGFRNFENTDAYNSVHPWLATLFYSNEGGEPIHVHAEKGDMECKYWLMVDEVEIREAFGFNLNPASRREIKMIIYQHFDLIVESWHQYFKK